MHTPTSRPELYDPVTSAHLVRAHRGAGGGAASCVVSDALWGDVLALLRWAGATLVGPPRLQQSTDRLAARFRAPGDRAPLCVLAVDVDDLGPGAVALLAEDVDWTVPT